MLARRQRGLVLLTLLLALTLASIALAGALDVWRLQRQRQQEAQLLFVGNQYRQAIQRYYRAGRTLPTSIADLLEDNRYPVPLHHLRRAYPDPITGRNDWQFMRQGDGFFGVYSSSALPTIKRAHFPRRYADFENATTYGEWRFFYLPPALRNRLTGAALDSATLAVQNAANVNAPDVNAPNVDTPNASTPNVNTPNANTPNANTPNANTPNRSTPNARGGGPSLGHNPAALR